MNPFDSLTFLAIVVALAWTYDFFNGMNDAANAIATTVSTRALTPSQAIFLAWSMNVLGAFITTAVAKTVGKGVVDPSATDQVVVISSLVAASVWSAACTYGGIPISITHALVGGLIGAAGAAHGLGVVKIAGDQEDHLRHAPVPSDGFSWRLRSPGTDFLGSKEHDALPSQQGVPLWTDRLRFFHGP